MPKPGRESKRSSVRALLRKEPRSDTGRARLEEELRHAIRAQRAGSPERRALAEKLFTVTEPAPVKAGERPARTSGRQGAPPRPLTIPDIPTRKPGTYRRARGVQQLPDIPEGGHLLGSPHRYRVDGWWERYDRSVAEEWVSREGRTVSDTQLKPRTVYERIRDDLLAFPPAIRERLGLRISSDVLPPEGFAVRVSDDDEEALGSIQGLMYAAGVKETPKSPKAGVTRSLTVEWFDLEEGPTEELGGEEELELELERPTRERPARERPARGRPARERPARERPARERPARERPARKAPRRDKRGRFAPKPKLPPRDKHGRFTKRKRRRR